MVTTSIIYQFVGKDISYNIVPVIVLTLIAGFIVFIKHKDNIIRLAKGEEQNIFSKK